jgi:hypothetical protein
MPLVPRALIFGLLWLAFSGVVLFSIAATVDYWQGWVLLAVSTLGSIPVASVMLRDPELLKRRMTIKERERGQMVLQFVVALGLLYALFFSAFDYRMGWSHVRPNRVSCKFIRALG